MARLKTQRATSAGGIVVRVRDGRPQLVVGMRRRERGVTWTLPKGTPQPGESLTETAIREVGEETGLRVEIRRPVGSIRYTFVADDVRIDKTVHYFLMEAVGGHLARHDREFARVRWVDLEAAPALLTFDTERELVARVGRLFGDGEGETPARREARAPTHRERGSTARSRDESTAAREEPEPGRSAVVEDRRRASVRDATQNRSVEGRTGEPRPPEGRVGEPRASKGRSTVGQGAAGRIPR